MISLSLSRSMYAVTAPHCGGTVRHPLICHDAAAARPVRAAATLNVHQSLPPTQHHAIARSREHRVTASFAVKHLLQADRSRTAREHLAAAAAPLRHRMGGLRWPAPCCSRVPGGALSPPRRLLRTRHCVPPRLPADHRAVAGRSTHDGGGRWCRRGCRRCSGWCRRFHRACSHWTVSPAQDARDRLIWQGQAGRARADGPEGGRQDPVACKDQAAGHAGESAARDLQPAALLPPAHHSTVRLAPAAAPAPPRSCARTSLRPAGTRWSTRRRTSSW